MSLLSPRLRIALSPGRASVAQRQEAYSAWGGQAGWEGGLAALAGLLAAQSSPGAASVILSQHFMRCFLLPPPAVWLNRREMQAWLEDKLKVPLDGAGDWRLSWQAKRPGRPVTVCAIRRRHLDDLGRTLAEAGVKSKAIVPWLTVAYQRRAKELRKATGWYALVEPGMACLLRLEAGETVGLRQRQLDADPARSLGRMIKRESLLQGIEHRGELWLDVGGVEGRWQMLGSKGRTVHELPDAVALHGAAKLS
ncbi:MAG TPA: hypothetical protein VF811_04180 [Parasulfuritortus sp.]